MELTYRDFTKKSMDMGPLGFEKGSGDETYFCTPKGAKIIGWAGVDGIHYCLIHGFGDMVFAVSPMNLAPHYVHPLARTFSDFLRLLLACGSCDALEQAWQWDEAQFQGFLDENPPTQEQTAALEQLAQQTGLLPMEHPWQYLHELQSGFAYDKIKYTEDYYDLDMNPDAPQPPPKWEVSFDGGFWSSRQGRPGKELPIRKEFDWAGYHWVIPSIYLCGKGIVVDFCMRVEPAAIRDFLKKWDLTPENETERQFTQEQQMQLDLDNPLHMDFHSLLHLNGKELHSTHGYGASYNPCLGPEYVVEDEAKRAVEHYGLDLNYAWVILRSSYPWATKRKPEIRQLSVTMLPDKVSFPGPHFQIRRPGEPGVHPDGAGIRGAGYGLEPYAGHRAGASKSLCGHELYHHTGAAGRCDEHCGLRRRRPAPAGPTGPRSTNCHLMRNDGGHHWRRGQSNSCYWWSGQTGKTSCGVLLSAF